MEISALSAARRITQLAIEDNITDLSPLKIQKLLYFIEGGLLASDDITSFFPETPQAWKYGPVYVDLYEKFKHKQSGETIAPSDFDSDLSVDFDATIEQSLKTTWDDYKEKSASELVTLSHRTDPWIIAKNFGLGSRISKEDMKEFFRAQTHERTT